MPSLQDTPFTQDVTKALAPAIGATGIPQAAYEATLARTLQVLYRLRDQSRDGSLPLLGLPAAKADLAPVKALAKSLRKGAKDIVFFGTGGSALGGETIAQLADYGVSGVAAFSKAPRVHFINNLDPVSLTTMFASLTLNKTKFVAISKSGGTGETLMQTMAAVDALTAAGLGEAIAEHIVGLSEPEKAGKPNALRALLAPYGCQFLDHHTGVGGRYSCLTNVGLLPAAILGLDIAQLRKGAAEALNPVLKARSPADVPAAVGAALQVAAMEAGKTITVIMPYTDRLDRFTKWFVQLWAESNGKNGKGSQPVATLGPVDQHSAQQLFLAGPRDKLFTVLTLDTKGKGPAMSHALASRIGEPGFVGKTIGDLVSAQGEAMVDTFASNGCAVRRIRVPVLNEYSLGALLMHFMLETIIAGYLMSVDPFDQPAVEEAKILAKRYLGEGR